ncbi:MAG TPA: YeeE/YedE thiosulfate transporter family protein [Denitromonas sp.]|uniref:YeeE/YedE thiosulfate transporter family protein n=1 Tax=Denitromonas sp. TaxID=2734609 RepID=UPI001D902D6B|nr:YeeE/YedE family protein [Rhodocyclaceae bacterium]MCP5223284.1 YeeE/YedE family protein [Zoogloeaceae bacterium]HQU88734.1 YeeE/YedE thiosulfate transporter family protein [Denitromonas sp.]HQV16181.1 YeeE/YedE thiosulfate transporter family protein [Denitromonas sp.]
MSLHLIFAIVLVAIIGFASHRASLCSVRAVAEVMSSRTAYMLASFGKAALWACLVSGILIFATGGLATPGLAREPAALVLMGGFVFGVGAAINGGCSLSTLQHLADGELAMGLTLLGFVISVAGWDSVDMQMAISRVTPLPSFWAEPSVWAGVLIAALACAGIWELIRVLRVGDDTPPRWRQRLVAPAYRLSTAALLMGVSGGILFGGYGAWTYTNFLRTEAGSWLGASMPPAAGHGLLLLALLGGMVLSALQRGSFRVRLGAPIELARRFGGGLLMGLGGALIPGGNDTLLLVAIPSLSPVALGAFVSMLLGIAAVMLVMRRVTGAPLVVRCVGDRCD